MSYLKLLFLFLFTYSTISAQDTDIGFRYDNAGNRILRVGLNVDTDQDGVNDINDACHLFDDSIDIDTDGKPDVCDDCPSIKDKIYSGLVIQQGVNEVYKATECIELIGGFTVESGAEFRAFTEGCD